VSRTSLYALSVGAHAALGVFLGTIPTAKHHDVVAISFTETRKAKPPAPAPLPLEPEPPPAEPAPVRSKVAPTPKAKALPVADLGAASSLNAAPDFGLSLGGSGGPGLAIPQGGPAPSAPPATVEAKALSRAKPAKTDECAEPAGKPKLLSRPTPVYTAEARVAGIAGKVRVEIVVDDRGQVTHVRLIEGLGHGLDESAMAAARAMTFEAAQRCGRAVSATFKVGFTFSPSAT